MKKVLIYLIIIFTLTACWWKTVEDWKIIQFWKFYFNIPKTFSLVVDKKQKIKDFKILFSYVNKKTYQDNLISSLLVLKYIWEYPKSEDNFFSVISDKFRRQIPGTKIISSSKLTKDNIKIYYFTYKVYDNLFNNKNEKASYYWLQVYIFDWKNIYLISYVSAKDDEIKTMLDKIKDLHINK